MQNLRKIKQLSDRRSQKLYELSEVKAKKSRIEKDNKALIESSIQPQVRQESAYFVIKNLDNNRVEIYKDDKTLDQKLLKQIDELPELQRLLESMWEKYLTDFQRQEEEFLEACYQGETKKVKSVVSGKNKHPIDPRTAVTDEGKNGIHLATISGSYRNIEIIKVLLNYKVDINGRTYQQKRTPLMLGSILGNQIAVKNLLELGADKMLQDYQGNTALHHACIFNQQNIVKVLLESNFPLNIANNSNKTPFELITNPKIIELLKQDKEISEQIVKQASIIVKSKIEMFDNDQMGDKFTQFFSEADTQYSIHKKNKIAQVAIKEIGLSSFKKLSMLGRGAFGEVYLVQNVQNQKRYAMKVLDKASIMRQNILRYAMTERKILSTINHNFIVKLQFAFQTPTKLFLVMDYCPGGDLLNLIKKRGKINQQMLKKYMAEIVLAIEALHRAEIIYRDLKPSNIIVDEAGHACLTDFGLSKQASLSHSFCGSTAYLAPQMLWRRGHTKVLDWYLLGVVIYQGLTGKPPFWDSNKEQLLANIKSGRYKHLGNDYSKQVRDLVQKLLRSNSNKRLGINGSKQIKSHPWFKELDWSQVESRGLKMEILQEIKGKPVKQEVFQQVLQEQQSKVAGWDYIPKNF